MYLSLSRYLSLSIYIYIYLSIYIYIYTYIHIHIHTYAARQRGPTTSRGYRAEGALRARPRASRGARDDADRRRVRLQEAAVKATAAHRLHPDQRTIVPEHQQHDCAQGIIIIGILIILMCINVTMTCYYCCYA